LTQLFEPFFTTKGAGLGLGLTISKRIVESFNGTIVARNRENGGASFCVSLPRYYQENQSESSK
jgi:two-component system C4-dicarboxylate transport sensor histidine kinase DctB